MCSDLDPGFEIKVEGHCRPFKSICEYIFFPLGSVGFRLNFPNVCLWVKSVQWPWTKFLCQGKVAADLLKKNPCPDNNFCTLGLSALHNPQSVWIEMS